MTGTAPPDTAAELRLIRKELGAIRRQVVREQEAREAVRPAPPPPPRVLTPRPVPVPQRHYRVMASLRSSIHRRAHLGVMSHSAISRQRRTALYLTLFAGVRCMVWLACMAFIGLYELGVGGGFITEFARLSATVLWVSVISYYCNAATEGAALTAGLAALFSSDSHAATVSLGADFDAMEADIARLADLQPGAEASELADGIRGRLQAASGRP